jgi:hypothetical protein
MSWQFPILGCSLAIALTGLLAAPEAERPASPLRLEITCERAEFPFRGAIPLTITYTNTTDELILLKANGSAPGEGFPGETFEITSGAGRKSYTIQAIDPAVRTVRIEPGKSWTRTIRELAVALSNTGITIDGRHLAATDPLPDPFGRLDDYTIQVRYEPTIRAQPKPAFNGTLESNVVKVKVVWR